MYDGERSFLIATSNDAPEELDGVLRWLGEQNGRWPGLNGRALISVPDAAPLTVPNPPPDLATPEGPAEAPGAWIWQALIGLVGLAVAGALFIAFRNRRRKGQAAAEAENKTADDAKDDAAQEAEKGAKDSTNGPDDTA